MSLSDFPEACKVGLIISLERYGSKSKSGKDLKVQNVCVGCDEPRTIVTFASDIIVVSRLEGNDNPKYY